MARKVYPKGKSLIEKFTHAIGDYRGFEIIKLDTICKFKFDDKCYYAYFKCVSHEGNPYPLEHQRAQLPQRKEFDEVKDSPEPFLFLGYDMDNDVFVCWEPHKVKPRLNKRKYVSFYSRLSIQQNVTEGKIREEVLTNGDKFILFKRTDVIPFLQMIETHFPELQSKREDIFIVSELNQFDAVIKGKDLKGRLLNIREDETIRILIDSFPENTTSLDIVATCMNKFGKNYNKMSFSDWGKVVRKYLQERNE